MFDNTLNQPSKFKTKTWAEINNDLWGVYNTNSQVKFKTSILRSSSCDYSDASILVKGTITVLNMAPQAADLNSRNKKVIFKNCAPFTDCTSEIRK